MKQHIGILESFFETGTEGLVWILRTEGTCGYDGQIFLENGDFLKVYKADGTVAFEGIIEQDHKAGWTEYPRNPGNGQPSALGMWIHWTQKGWAPDDWARLFTVDYCRAEARKRKETINRITFTKEAKRCNGLWYFNEKDIDRNRIDGQERPNTIKCNFVAAQTDDNTLVFSDAMSIETTAKGLVLRYYYEDADPKKHIPRGKILKISKKLIAKAYMDRDLVYTAKD